jgi:DNA-binding CsgD family transcriptional regulator
MIANPLLSKRQRQVLTLIAVGRTDADIAKLLFLGRETVRSHTQAIRKALGVTSRAAIITSAYRLNLVDETLLVLEGAEPSDDVIDKFSLLNVAAREIYNVLQPHRRFNDMTPDTRARYRAAAAAALAATGRWMTTL